MPISHLGICVPAARFDEVVAFYKATLAPLGYIEHMRPVENVVGLGARYPDFWITGVKEEEGDNAGGDVQRKPIHFAFDVSNRTLVHDFHAAALGAGGKCNGPPGPRPQYNRFYYASFVLDPVGNNIEAICMWPAWTHWQYWAGSGVFRSSEKTGSGSE
ncbi:hypothetical protein AJ79_03481 [Helicocarpus griseus UAMH5409]|uniref:VOC domain-containing protein n=1 Tax=Helicocarpus griseus UAMH5409 TaxID=1447875 RepID=A0A2B7XYC9_9EURO|nr:hypothetical protein AJ79_03481 [Helicocarpus griseus UAMH5409]